MKKRVLIIGGVAGGAGTAARLRRLDEEAEIIIIERGDYISFANCGLPYYIGDVITEREDLLVVTKEMMEERFNIDVRIRNEAVKIDKENKKITVKHLATLEEYELEYDTLVLSTGSSPLRPPIDGIDGSNIFTLWNMKDTDRVKSYVRTDNPKSAVVIGGGFIGLEMVENLTHLGVKVSLVEMQPHVMPNIDSDIATVVQDELITNGVRLYLNDGVTRIIDKDDRKKVMLRSGETISCDMVMLCAGVKPNGELARNAGIKTNTRGGIIIDQQFKTSWPDIYALGDVAEVESLIDHSKTMIPLAGPANKQARLCADVIAEKDSRYIGSMGSSVAKIFTATVASTGLTKTMLEKNGMIRGVDFFELKTHTSSHATYYPGATDLAIKVLFDGQGKILGAQAVGQDGVEKRIDVIATVITIGGSVYDLKDLELCYAPPFSSAKDPVNMLGFMADNHRNGLVTFLSQDELLHLDKRQTILLDVRDADELEEGSVSGAINIPLTELRKQIHKLDRTKKIVVICGIGLRAYIACRILKQHDFTDVVDLSGGYTSYAAIERCNVYSQRAN